MPRNRKILVLDDQAPVARLVGTYLKEAGFDVTVQVDALDALDIVTKSPFDLIVTDFVLESMTGLEFVDQMPKRTPRTPVVLMSGSDHSGVKAATKRRGIDGFIPKPIDRSLLLEMVRMLLKEPADGASPAP